MLRHLHFVVLFFSFLSHTSAFHFPVPFLRARQQSSSVASPANQAVTSSLQVTGGTDTTITTGIGGAAVTQTETVTTPSLVPSPATQSTVTTGGLATPTVTASLTRTTVIPPSSTSISSISSAIVTSVSSSSVSSISSITTHSSASSVSVSSPSVTSAPTSASEFYTTIIVTANGKTSTSVSKATTTPTSTAKASLADGTSGGTSTVSDMAKKVVAGVVGGIGGALLIAGIAYALYRVYHKKKARRDVLDDELYGGGSNTSLEKKGSTRNVSSGWGPSRVTDDTSEPLDRYKAGLSPTMSHKSPMSFNTASNF